MKSFQQRLLVACGLLCSLVGYGLVYALFSGTDQPFVVFDSNRSGTFGIYRVPLEGGEVQAVSDSELQEMHPAPSPNGAFVAYTKAETVDRNSPSEIWVKDLHSDSPENLLIKNASYPSFSSDGKTVFFQRERKQALSFDLKSKEEKLLFPKPESNFGNFQVVQPRVSPEGKTLCFTTDKSGRWNVYCAELETQKFWRIGHGCEPTWISEKEVVWVQRAGMKQDSGFSSLNLEIKETKVFHDEGAPFGHEYFPAIESQGQLLLYSACPPGQHSHLDSNYQVFLRDFKSAKLTRLTDDKYNNRWPRLVIPSQTGKVSP